jgi:Ca2+-transporting ATPase
MTTPALAEATVSFTGEPGDSNWHSLPALDIAARLAADLQLGLSSTETARRQAVYGPNELRETPPPTFWARLLDQFKSFVVLILIAASLLSIILGDYVEAAAIMAIVLLNAVLGVVQESRAEAALASLRKLAAPVARVLREGHHLDVPARQLVPGDVVLLSAGQYVPADVRLVESVNLRVDEAPFTGESVPVEKEAHRDLPAACLLAERVNMAYMGTVMAYGRGRGLVVATGMETEIGRIATLMQAQPAPPTPLQEKLDELGRTLSLAALALCGLVFVGGVARHFNWLDMLLIAVSLAIAAVPEGLPAVVTLSLALGMREMVHRHAVIRKLPAVETLGATTIICTDKTGTLTQNKMKAVRLYVNEMPIEVGSGFTHAGQPLTPPEQFGLEFLLRGALLCNDARLEADGENYRSVGDPTEVALVAVAAQAGLRREIVENELPRVDEIPFEAGRQRMSTLHRQPNGYRLWTKGASEVLLAHSGHMWLRGHAVPLTPAFRTYWEDVAREFARAGWRVLAVAYRDFAQRPSPLTAEIENQLTLVGLMGLADPARPEVAPAIALARSAGVRTLMITGDQPLTARYIAAQSGLLRPEGEVLLGADLDALSFPELAARLERVDVIARAAPAHKVKIVEALQARGHVVAMTGDGVNDAPALRRADIGVAMGRIGTDVAKEAADMVLTDDNYASIVAAIEQGRAVYDNIRKFVYYLLSCNVAEIAALFIGTLAGWPPVLTAVQLLWLNLITDGAPALALGLEKGDPDLMRRRPRRRTEPIIDQRMILGIVVQTVALTAVTLTAYGLGRQWLGTRLAETMAFVTLSSAELLRAYTARSERHLLARLGLLSNPYMQFAVGTSLLLLMLVVYVPFLQPIFNTTPLGMREWSVLAPLILIPALAAEALKWLLGGQTRSEQIQN